MTSSGKSNAPSTHGPNGGKRGRDANGRFATGNKLGVGNPLAGRVARLRATLLASVTEKDMKAITKTLVQAARAGDTSAIKLLFNYVLGTPEAADVAQRLDELENRLNIGGTR